MPQERSRPGPEEAAPYYYRYIDRITSDDVVGVLEAQLAESKSLFSSIPAEKSLHAYEAGKWTIRDVVNHVTDCERLFVFRAFWFARGFDSALPSFDQDDSAASARANDVPWPAQIEDFESVRRATITFFRNLPAEAWARAGVASGNPFTVRSLAYITAGHFDHHRAILKERYL